MDQLLGVKRVSPRSALLTINPTAYLVLTAALDYSVELNPGNHSIVPTGLSFEVPEGFELVIEPLPVLQHKFLVGSAFNTVQAGDSRELRLNMMNLGRWPYTIAPGQEIATAVLRPVTTFTIKEIK